MRILLSEDGGDGNGAADAGTKAPFYRDWYGEDGSFSSDKWTESLPDDLARYQGTFSKYKTVPELLHGFANATRMATGKGLEPLPPDASDQLKTEWAAQMRRATGAPEDIAGYGVKRPDNLPEDMWSDERANKALEIMHKYHAPPAMVAELFDLNANDALSSLEQNKAAMDAAKAEELNSLKEYWKDKFDENMGFAQRSAKTLGIASDDPIMEYPEFLKAMATMHGMVSESKLVAGDDDPNPAMTNLQKAKDILENPANPLHKAFHDPMDPMHKHALAERSKFNRLYSAEIQKKAA